jgi:integrase
VNYEGADPITGRGRRRWLPADNETEARTAAAQLSDAGGDARPQRFGITVARYLTTRWLPSRAACLRPTTHFRYQKMVEQYVLPRIGRVPLARLTPRQLERLYRDLLARGRCDRRGLAPKTVLNVHQLLRKALGDAVRTGVLSRNVALLVDPPKPRTSPEQRCWTASQLRSFLQGASGHRLFPALWLAATTGMRRGEIAGLQWDDLDPDTGQLSIRRAISCTGYRTHITSTKTRTSRRCIDLDGHTLDVLLAWRGEQVREVGHEVAVMFSTIDGRPLHPHVLSQTFNRLTDGADLPRIRMHDLRHTHATLLLKAGVPLKVVSERLGHSSPAFTMTVYQHVLPGMQRAAAELFGTLLTTQESGCGAGRRR